MVASDDLDARFVLNLGSEPPSIRAEIRHLARGIRFVLLPLESD
jgi:hypothetical protein